MTGTGSWIPYSGETEEELQELLDDARELPEEEPAPAVVADRGARAATAPSPLPRRARSDRSAALTFWFVESRTGWNGLDSSTRAEATARFSEEASRVAGKPVTIRCDEAGDYVGAVQHADGVAVVGGDLAYLTPERCIDLYRLAFKDEVRSSRPAAPSPFLHTSPGICAVSDEGTTECYALQSGVEQSGSGSRRTEPGK